MDIDQSPVSDKKTKTAENTPNASRKNSARNSIIESKWDQVLSGIPIVESIKQLEVIAKRDLINPFDFVNDSEGRVVALPKNIQKLCQDNYLIFAGTTIFKQRGYDIKILEKEYEPRLKLSSKIESYLKALCIYPLAGKLPELPNNRGPVYRGAATSLKYYLEQGSFTSRINKFHNVQHPAREIFGDIWAKGHPEEKKLLDLIIHETRHKETNDQARVELAVINFNKLVSDLKLNINFNSKLLQDVEVLFFEEYLNKNNVLKRFHYDKNLNSLDALKDFDEAITARQAELRKVKEISRRIESRRIQAALAPFKGRAKQKAAKVPIQDLANEVRRTPDWAHFNPTLCLSLIGIGALPSLQNDKEEWFKAYQEQKSSLVKAMVSQGYSEPLAHNFAESHTEFLQFTNVDEKN